LSKVSVSVANKYNAQLSRVVCREQREQFFHVFIILDAKHQLICVSILIIIYKIRHVYVCVYGVYQSVTTERVKQSYSVL
jgi:hypothetical protein